MDSEDRSAITFECPREWAEWLRDFANSQGRSPAHLINLAVGHLASERRFGRPPEWDSRAYTADARYLWPATIRPAGGPDV